MPVDPQAQALLDQLAAANAPPFHALSVEDARKGLLAVYRGEPEDVAAVENWSIPGPAGDIPIRIYTPAGSGPFPVVVFFHGGGWVLGDLESHDVLCRAVANGADSVVVAVDYRLAPEHKFPAAAEDCYAATVWTAANAASLGADPARLAVLGDSAGGNLAAVVCLMARDRGAPQIAFQVLAYPVTDYVFDSPSYQECADGFLLSRDSMIWFWRHYLPDEASGQNPYASPLREKDLSGLPPAFVLTGEYDPLRSEGDAYAERLREAGVKVQHQSYSGLIHGFLTRPQLDRGKAALADVNRALREALRR